MIECYHLFSSKQYQSARMNEQRTGIGATASIEIRITKVRADGNNACIQKV